MTERIRRAAAPAGWLVVALVMAVGAAGVAAAGSRPPVEGTRPELSWTTDQALLPVIAAAASDMAGLSDQVDRLGAIGRNALVAIVNQDAATAQTAIADGESKLAAITAATDALRARLAAVPGIGPTDATRIGSDVRSRYDILVAAVSATDGLAAWWTAVTRGSLAAIELSGSLADHDKLAAAAGLLGRSGAYGKALAQLDKADIALATSRALRDRLSATVDVIVLSSWIDRNAAFDVALRKVWTLLEASRGKVTAAIKAAFAELTAAEDALPPDGRGLVVIMSDVARGEINQAVIAIDRARSRLAAAVDAVGLAGPDASASPSSSPTPAP